MLESKADIFQTFAAFPFDNDFHVLNKNISRNVFLIFLLNIFLNYILRSIHNYASSLEAVDSPK